MLERFKQRFARKVETVQYQAIQLVSVKRSYLERRDKGRFRELVDIPAEITLSEEQVTAATSHAKETLVVAGAGSGKTFVLVGRAKYLVGSERTSEDKILMLAYNKDAAEELSRRTKASGISVTAQTFHGFGNSVIKAPGERTGVAFGDNGEVTKFLAHQLQHGLDDESKNGLAKFFAEDMVPKKDYEEFESLTEYSAYVRATIPRTLMDEQVKSHGEWLIANFLYTHGIEYEYESLYDQGKTPKDRHKPDFVVRSSGHNPIWIEYFGTDRAQSVAPGISQEGYLESIKWKKELHNRNASTLVDLYYYDLKEGNLLKKLESHLKQQGVKFKPRSTDEILRQANRIGYDSRFLKVCEQFLGHVRAKRMGTSGVNGSAGKDGNTLWSGVKDPESNWGTAGDIFINSVTKILFGPKDLTTGWSSSVSMIGPKGDQGPGGASGGSGPSGANGTNATIAITELFLCDGPDVGTVADEKCQIGMAGPGGGSIFFVDYNDQYGMFNYLEAAPTSCEGTKTWSSTNTSVVGANGWAARAVGVGSTNTVAIKAVFSADTSSNNAAWFASACSAGSKSDWFLGSLGEMKLMYDNLQGLGEFVENYYWSSSDANASYAWTQNFTYGPQETSYKPSGYKVRPMRTF